MDKINKIEEIIKEYKQSLNDYVNNINKEIAKGYKEIETFANNNNYSKETIDRLKIIYSIGLLIGLGVSKEELEQLLKNKS